MRGVLSLGSNLGDRQRTIHAAVDDIGQVDGVHLVAISRLFETPALKLTGIDQAAPAYINCVVLINTSLEPEPLLSELNRIEAAHGRVREEVWGDRTLDIDIISVDDLQQQSSTVTLPHPRAAERSFVLVPWFDVDPNAVLPGVGPIAALHGAHTVLRAV
jgi:2-amino-4-hydroxy-6-hydroxymethyldihydropteridine diphosphokinase